LSEKEFLEWERSLDVTDNGSHYGWWRGNGIGWTYYPYPFGWDYYSDYSYYNCSQPYASQYWYYCSDPAGYYPRDWE
jgi:hypothetical protein